MMRFSKSIAPFKLGATNDQADAKNYLAPKSEAR